MGVIAEGVSADLLGRVAQNHQVGRREMDVSALYTTEESAATTFLTATTFPVAEAEIVPPCRGSSRNVIDVTESDITLESAAEVALITSEIAEELNMVITTTA